MKKNLQIREANVSFDSYFAIQDISEQAQDKLNSTDILAIPMCYSDGEYYFAQETISSFPDDRL